MSEVEKKTIPNCSFLWSQSVVNHARRILEECDTEDDVLAFFEECEGKIKNMDKDCRIVWNTEPHSFGGEDFAYIWFLYSDKLSSAIKISVNINVFDKTIVIGNITIASKKEERKLERHLVDPPEGPQQSPDPISQTTEDLNTTEDNI